MAQNSEFLTLVARLEAAVARLEGLGARADSTTATVQGIASLTGEGKGAAAGVTAPAPVVAAFDELVQTRVGRLLVVADKIGGQVLQSSQLLQRAFEAEKSIVFAISQCKV
jgi:adenylyl cyclase-associated protein